MGCLGGGEPGCVGLVSASALGNWLVGVDLVSSAVGNRLTGRGGRWRGWGSLWELGPSLDVAPTLQVDTPGRGGVCWGLVSILGSCASRGSGLVWVWVGGGISAAVSGFHVPNRSFSLAMASSWLWCEVAGELWMAQESNFRACRMCYSGVSVGWLT